MNEYKEDWKYFKKGTTFKGKQLEDMESGFIAGWYSGFRARGAGKKTNCTAIRHLYTDTEGNRTKSCVHCGSQR
jgi:hypothetical protein